MGRKGIGMSCIETQKAMHPFLEEQMDVDSLREFMAHIQSCESCREDLEVYYTLFTGMKLLDEDKGFPVDYKVDYNRRLRRAEDEIRRDQLRRAEKRIGVLGIAILLALLL